jgi:hypothetical protein
MHCVWLAGQTQTFNQCRETPKQAGLLGGRNLNLLWLLLLVCLLILIILYFRAARFRRYLALAAVAILIVFGLALLFGRTSDDNMSNRMGELQPGKAYYWKVIAEDGKGGTIESETRRFRTK